MNIMNVVFSFNNGGIENLLIDLLNNWDTTDDNINLCIINSDYDEDLLNKIDSSKCEITLLNRPVGGRKCSFVKEFNKIIKEKKISIIHCHNNDAVKFCLYSKALNKNIKLIYTVHDTRYSKINYLDMKIHQHVIDEMIAISESVKEEICKKNHNLRHLNVLYNGTDSAKFSGLKFATSIKKIVCISRLVPETKGQDILIRAIGELTKQRQDFECLIVGEAPVDKINNLEMLKVLVKELEIEKYVKFLGNRIDVPEILERADVFVLPSRYEGFGIVIIEAMLSKTPVIVSAIEGPKEIVKDNLYGYLFENENYHELAELINCVLNNDQTELVNRTYAYAYQNYSIGNMVNKLRNIYE